MRSLWEGRERIYKRVTRRLSTTVAPSRQKTLEKRALTLDTLPGWLCRSLQGHLLHPYLFVSAGLTGATEQKCWHLVSTNEKWQMHKSFRLCRVEIPGWHSRRLFGGSTDEYFRGKRLVPPLTCWNGQCGFSSLKPFPSSEPWQWMILMSMCMLLKNLITPRSYTHLMTHTSYFRMLSGWSIQLKE